MSWFQDPDPDAADVFLVKRAPKLTFFVLHDHALLLPDIMAHPGPSAEAPVHDVVQEMFQGWDPVKDPTGGPANRIWEMEQADQREVSAEAIKITEEALEAVKNEAWEADNNKAFKSDPHKEPERYQQFKAAKKYECGGGCGDPIEKGELYRQAYGRGYTKLHVECWNKYYNVTKDDTKVSESTAQTS